ncbi:MAG: hypothetical protein PF450_05520, partial [Bacteroidales bacterium]|nr:hypothetical protein [Bacteroidales bacterium]
MKLSRRDTIRILGAGTVGLLSQGFIYPIKENRHIITLSFDDGFKKSSIKTAEIFEKYNLSSCLNIISSAHVKQFKYPNE